ncbi:hypothetical protein A203_18615 [Chromobacterium violaceum]|uniref:hypothetical protein n=1 Tax=Chromobacterium violaceum TaxID=536 RepID=UPI0038581C07
MIPTEYRDFCRELADLSRKYGIVIEAVGGVATDVPADQLARLSYCADLDSGDLMPKGI